MKKKTSWLIGWRDVLTMSGPASILFSILINFKLPVLLALGISVAALALILNIVAMTRMWNRAPKVYFVASDKGEGADRLVKLARDKICMTHASGIEPHDVYQDLLLEKLAKRVKIERYVQRDASHSLDKYKWLEKFANKKGYEQFEVPGNCPLPLDIMTFDDDTVVLHLPRQDSGDDFYSAIIIEDRRIKQLFDNVFRRLRLRCQHSSAARSSSVGELMNMLSLDG